MGNGNVHDMVTVEDGNIEAPIIHRVKETLLIVVKRVIAFGGEFGEEDMHHLHEVTRMDELGRTIHFLHEDRSLSCDSRVDDSLLRFHHYGFMEGEDEGWDIGTTNMNSIGE